MNTSTDGLSIVAEALGVSVKNGDREKQLLDGITFTVEPGEFICVLGPSGAGKTTLVRALLGLTQPTTGTVSIGGLDPTRDADSLRGQVGYVPQQDIIPASLPCERAFYYAAKIRLPAETPADDVQRAIDRVVNDVRLEHVRHTPAGILSGGEIKRGSLAVELLSKPGLLIVDEATSSLDPASEARIMNLLADRARAGMTVFCITHHLDNVDRAHKIMILGHGRVLWIGSRVESLGHFEVNRLSDVYLAIEDKPAEYWQTNGPSDWLRTP
jgi:ABC-type multidrug transport system ATPase subunit